MKIVLSLTEQQLECLKSGKRIPGSLHIERTSDEQIVIGFNQYHRNGGNRPHAQQLLTLPHGWVRKSHDVTDCASACPTVWASVAWAN